MTRLEHANRVMLDACCSGHVPEDVYDTYKALLEAHDALDYLYDYLYECHKERRQIEEGTYEYELMERAAKALEVLK